MTFVSSGDNTLSSSSRGPSMTLPTLGLGTYLLKGDVCKQAVLDALRLGFRYIDTASQYGNEAEVAAAIRESGVDRKEIVISTKVGPRQMKKGYPGVIEACQDSLRLLDTDYIDIIMLHWPGVANIALDSPKHAVGRREAWRALEDMRRQGRVRCIAVSNFLEQHMSDVVVTTQQQTSSGEVAATTSPSEETDGSPVCYYPFLNQIELHPLCRQRNAVTYCRDHGILVQQYTPVAQCHPRMLTHPGIVAAVEGVARLLAEDPAVKPLGFPSFETGALTGADVCLLWGFWTPCSDGLVVRSTKPAHLQRALELLRFYQECSGATRESLVNILERLDAETSPTNTATNTTVQVERVGGADENAAIIAPVPVGDFHTCWHSGLVS